MNTVTTETPAITRIEFDQLPSIGAPLGGGFFANIYKCGNDTRALISAPKVEGERKRVIYAPNREMLLAARSFTDGLGNTRAMANAGSKVAKDFLALRIGGADDWCIGALDQEELKYRAFKPTAQENFCMSGCNVSAIPPTQRYMPDFPAQTSIELFRKGGAEAFETDEWYLTSTQYAGDPDYAWGQDFTNGHQGHWFKDDTCRARAVRSILVI